MSWGVIVLLLAAGIAGLTQAFLVRAGKYRGFYAIYQTNAPPWVRNRAFAGLPVGVFLIPGAAAIAFSDADIRVGAGLMVIPILLGLALSVVWLFKPPEFMKPEWLRAVESGAAPEPASSFPMGVPGRSGARRIYLPPPVYWSLWAATVAVFVLWLTLGWSWSVLVGLGAAISTLAASTPRRAGSAGGNS